MKVISEPKQIDLAHHAVIEASAGTGKTYTITHLVLRLLLEQGLSINQILLVTFTDKATSELKTRIYESIKSKVAEQGVSVRERDILTKALNELHLANIHTIHGFCQRVLKEYAFEQGSVLDKTLVDDNTVYIKQLQTLKRTWPAIEGIDEKLKKTELSIQQMDDLLIDLAKQIKPGDVIFPGEPEKILTQLKQQLNNLETEDLRDVENDFKNLKGLTTKVLENRWNNKLLFVVEKMHAFKNKQLLVEELSLKLPELKKAIKAIISKAEFKKHAAFLSDEAAPLFFKYLAQLKETINAMDAAVKAENYQFVIEMIEALKTRVKLHKLNQGQISYDDMIADLAEALERESEVNEQPLTQCLRAKFKVALIDEFQDTDAQQWSIFQWLFTHPEQSHRLVLIGDPKQSIYGFRGANIHTYEAAKIYLMDCQQGNGYRLSSNYRSLSELTQLLNQFFTHQSHEQQAWYDHDDVVVSSPSVAQCTEIGGPFLLEDDSGLLALNTMSVTGEGLLVGELKQQMAIQIARIIHQQLLGRVSFQRKGSKKTLNAADICILVRNKKDAKPIEQAFDQLKIPHSFYKKTDLYQTEAAIQIQLILTALAFPQMKKQVNNAWLSLFFDLSAEQIKILNQYQDLVSKDELLSQFSSLWFKLKALSAQQKWVAVFYTLFEETGTIKRLYAAGNWRLLANLKQIKQELLQSALERQLDAHGMLHLLLSSRSSQLISKEDWQQKDTELPAVQIMTIHSSKGLEFPVVFLFGGFSASSPNHLYCKYHDPTLPAQVFNLADKNSTLYLTEEEAENKRLYYVAMTRAVFKLFIPVYESTTYQSKQGAVFFNDKVVARLFDSQLAFPVKSITASEKPVRSDVSQPSSVVGLRTIPSLPTLPQNVANKSRFIHSFSSLQKQADENTAHYGKLAQVTTEQADESNVESLSSLQDKPSIPGGAQTGNVLHGIFENLDFNLVNNSLKKFIEDQEVVDVIRSQMEAFLMADGDILDADGRPQSSYLIEFASWAWHTLNKPIDVLGGMRLCELSDTNRRHEMSFYWSKSDHVLTGFIDLLFKVKGQVNGVDCDEYFILDWKSNFNAGGYAPKVLADQVMSEHNYHDQYRWYTLAIKAWFNSLQLDHARLTGALYVFSRGIDCEANDQNGVFFQDLTTEEYTLTHLEAQLINKIETSTDLFKGDL